MKNLSVQANCMTVLFFWDNGMEYEVILDVQVKCLFLGLHLHFVVAVTTTVCMEENPPVL